MTNQGDLQSWRKPRRTWSWRPWFFAIGCAGLALVLFGIGKLLWSPYHVPKVYVLALTPVQENADHEAHQIPALISSRTQALQATLSAVGERGSFWDIPVGLNINALRRLKAFSFERENESSLGILYLCGLVDFHDQEVFVYGSSAARGRGEGVSIEQVFSFAESSCYSSCLILIDVIPEIDQPLDAGRHVAKVEAIRQCIDDVLPNARTQIGFLVQTASAFRETDQCLSAALAEQIETARETKGGIKLGQWLDAISGAAGQAFVTCTPNFDRNKSFAFFHNGAAGLETEGSPETQLQNKDSKNEDSHIGPTGKLVSVSAKTPEILPPFVQATDLASVPVLDSSLATGTRLSLAWARLAGLTKSQAFRRYPNQLHAFENRLVAFEQCWQVEAHSGGVDDFANLASELSQICLSLTPESSGKPIESARSLFLARELQHQFLIPAQWTLDAADADIQMALQQIDETLLVAQSSGQTQILTDLVAKVPETLANCLEVQALKRVVESKLPDDVKCDFVVCKLLSLQLANGLFVQSEHELEMLQNSVASFMECVRKLEMGGAADHSALVETLHATRRDLEELSERCSIRQSAHRLLILLANELPEWLTILPPVALEAEERDEFVFAVGLVSRLSSLLTFNDRQGDQELEDATLRLWRLRQSWLRRGSAKTGIADFDNGDPTIESNEWRSPRWDLLQVSTFQRIDNLKFSSGESADVLSATDLIRIDRLLSLLGLPQQALGSLRQTIESCLEPGQGQVAWTKNSLLMSIRTEILALLASSVSDDEQTLFQSILAARLAGQLHDYADSYDSKTQQILRKELEQFVQARFGLLEGSLVGANERQQQELQIVADGLRDIEKRLILPTAKFREPLFKFEIPEQIALTTQADRQTVLKITNTCAEAKSFELNVAFDSSVMHCRIQGDTVYRRQDVAPGETVLVPLVIRRTASFSSSKAIVLRLSSEDFSIQRQINTNIPRPPMVSADWVNVTRQEDGLNDLTANCVEEQGLRIRNETAADSFAFRLWTCDQSISDLYQGGVVNEREAEEILGIHNCSLATMWTAPVRLLEGETTRAVFAPAKKEAKKVDEDFSTLILECKSSDGRIQLLGWQPRVEKPENYVSSVVNYDGSRQLVRFDFRRKRLQKLDRDIPIEFSAFRSDTLERIDDFILTIPLGHDSAKTQWANFPVGVHSVLFCINVDGWPSTFLYEVEVGGRSGQIEQYSDGAFVLIDNIAVEQKVLHGDGAIEVTVRALGANSLLDDPQWRSSIGLDLNRNRILDDGTTMEMISHLDVEPRIVGYSKGGSPLIKMEVGGRTVRLPFRKEWNTHATVLAAIHRQSEVRWSPAQAVTFDNSPPLVISAESDSSINEVGQPTTFSVVVDDQGLSGVIALQGAWSLNGVVEWDPSKATDALKQEPGLWKLVLPTKGLLPGRRLAVFRAMDKAGHESEVFSKLVTLHSPEQAAALRSKSTAIVGGSVTFGKTPLEGMKLKLVSKPSGQTKPSEKSKPEVKPLEASCATDAAGHFAFLNVPKGDYSLELKGLVRGMQENRVIAVQVVDDVKPVEVSFRMDLPAVQAK